MVEDSRKNIAKGMNERVIADKVNEVIQYTQGIKNIVDNQSKKIVELESKILAQAALVNQQTKPKPAPTVATVPPVQPPVAAAAVIPPVGEPTTPPPAVEETTTTTTPPPATETKTE